jgi:spermidine synthase
VLDSEDFYADCRALLTEDGCMTVNLFGRSSSYERSLEKIAAAFGADAVWAFKPTREGNTVVLAQRTPSRRRSARCLPSARKRSRLAGACPRPSGCGCSSP